MTLTSVMTLESQKGPGFWSMAYVPDGKRMISVVEEKTVRQWDLQAGKEIEEVRYVCEGRLHMAVVSRDGRWVMISDGDEEYMELKAYEVETGIMKTFLDSQSISYIDISADGKLLAGVSEFDRTVLIWGMDTGKRVAGPFEIDHFVHTVRFSPDSKKLAVQSCSKKCLEVWDIQTQKLEARVGKQSSDHGASAPIFWTKKGTILSVFNFDFDHDDSKLTTIYEFDAFTLETVGDPFQGHTETINGLVLSFADTLLASSSFDKTIKLWSLEPHQLLASFHVQYETEPLNLIFSPDARQLAYWADNKIFICSTPPDILAGISVASDAQTIVSAPDISTLNHLLNADATRRLPNVHRKPATSPTICLPPRPLQPIHTQGLQRPVFFRHLRNLLSFSSHLNAVPPVENSHSHDPLDIPATSSRVHGHTPVPHPIQGYSHSDTREHPQRTEAQPTTLSSATTPTTLETRIQHVLRWRPVQTSYQGSPTVDVPLAQGLSRNAASGAPKDNQDLIPDEYFDASSQNPDSQQSSATALIDNGEHGHSTSCFCF